MSQRIIVDYPDLPGRESVPYPYTYESSLAHALFILRKTPEGYSVVYNNNLDGNVNDYSEEEYEAIWKWFKQLNNLVQPEILSEEKK